MCCYHTSTHKYALNYYYQHSNADDDGCADYTDDVANNAGGRTHNHTRTYYRTHHDGGDGDYTAMDSHAARHANSYDNHHRHIKPNHIPDHHSNDVGHDDPDHKPDHNSVAGSLFLLCGATDAGYTQAFQLQRPIGHTQPGLGDLPHLNRPGQLRAE